MAEQKLNRIAVFKNDKGDNPKRPDYTGNFDVAGIKFRLSMWDSVSQKGLEYWSGNIEKVEEDKQQNNPAPAIEGADIKDEDIPF